MKDIAKDDRMPIFLLLVGVYGVIALAVSNVGATLVALMAIAHFMMLVRAGEP